jgi:hypothetical protein
VPRQIDPADGKQVAPKNVVVMMMSFGPLNDGSNKHRLEAKVVGSGKAWIATNGRTIVGTWKNSVAADRLRQGRQTTQDRSDLHPGHAARLEGHDPGRRVPPAEADTVADCHRIAVSVAERQPGRFTVLTDQREGTARIPTSA